MLRSARVSWVFSKRAGSVLAGAVALLLMAASARAQSGFNEGPGPAKRISAGLLLGYGISFEDVNPWAVGLGLRGGYNLNQVYLGGRFAYHFGESFEVVTSGLSRIETSLNLWELGVEGGYDILVADRLWVRPQVGLGIATRTASSDAPVFGAAVSADESSTNPYLAFGVTGLLDVTPDIFLGLAADIQVVLGNGSPGALVLMLNGGVRF